MATTRHLDEAQLWAFAAGEEVPGAEAAAHLAACAACQQRVAQSRSLRSVVSLARPGELGPGARAAALARGEEALARENAQRTWWWERRSMLVPALGLAAAAGAGMALMLAQPPAPLWPPAGAAAAMTAAAPARSVAPELEAALDPNPALASAADPMDAVAPPAVANNPAPAPAAVMVAAGRAVRTRPSPQAVPAPDPAAALPEPAGIAADIPADLPMVAVADVAPATTTQLEVSRVHRFESVELARRALGAGRPLEAVTLALTTIGSAVGAEQAAALVLVREVALRKAAPGVVEAVEAAAENGGAAAEELDYLACESAVLSRQPEHAVERCRGFVRRHPQSTHARDASYVAGTLARDRLGDCAGAIADYERALVFMGPLGSLNDDALFWRAFCRAEIGQREAARQDLIRFLARYPSRRVDPQIRALQLKLGR